MMRRPLLTQIVVAAALLVAVNAAAGRFAQSRFIPLKTINTALAKGDHCVAVMGASQMVAALDERAFEAAYSAVASPRCVANVAIGGMFVNGQVMAYREYRESGKRPAIVVLGFTAAGLLDDRPIDPDAMQGNMAAVLYWSHADDVTVEYPDAVRNADDRLRFLIRRSTTLTSLESVFWLRAQQWQGALKGQAPQQRNRFGLVGDMRQLAANTANEINNRLEEQRDLGGWHEHRWFTRLKEDLAGDGTQLVVVELPTPALIRDAAGQSPLGARYHAWLSTQAKSQAYTLLDLSRPEWLTDGMFEDDLHLNAEGAARFSTDLATAVAELSRSPRR